jgi:peptide subunit release factor RF-3
MALEQERGSSPLRLEFGSKGGTSLLGHRDFSEDTYRA